MLFCSCPMGDQTACAERRRQTIVPICSYEDKDKPNCLSLQNACKTNYICRSRLADFISNCQPETRSISGCLRENYADCLLSYSGLIGTVMTPNYVRSLGISLSPWCDCSSSGNSKPDCDKFAEFFTNNRCLRPKAGVKPNSGYNCMCVWVILRKKLWTVVPLNRWFSTTESAIFQEGQP
ncbi:hypothetical protein INR49_013705, partial [Caranx melampygus]